MSSARLTYAPIGVRGPGDLHGHLGKRIKGKAHGGLRGIYGGVPFEGELVGIADLPQALVRDARTGVVHHLTIDTLCDVEVEVGPGPRG